MRDVEHDAEHVAGDNQLLAELKQIILADGNLAGSAHNPYLTAEARACAVKGWGENVGRTYGTQQPDTARIMSAWMASTGHRANILRGSFTHIGIGIDRGSNGYWTYVLDFGSR